MAHVFEYMDKDAFEFVVVAPPDKIFEEFCQNLRIPYYYAELERGNNPVKNAGVLLNLIKAIRKEKPDIIHAHSAKGGFLGRIAAKFTGTKVIYTPHAFSYLSFTGMKRMVFFGLETMAKKWTDLLLAISYSEANRAVYELGHNKNKVNVILNAVPVDLKPAQPVGGNIKIRMIGRLTLQKNHMLFLEVANILLKKYPNVEFSVLGAGIHDHLADEINAYLEEHNLTGKIKFESWGDPQTSIRFLQEADIYVMTSVFEGLPFSLLEAMLLEKPCVVTRVDGNTDVIQNNENGFSCLTVDEFVEKLESLITQPELRLKIGRAAAEYVKSKHDIRKTIKQLEAVYTNI